MTPESAVAPKKRAKVYNHAKYSHELRDFRKKLGYRLVHWYVHETVYAALMKAASRDNRKMQQYVGLNIWKMVPKDLHPKHIPLETLILPKQKKVRLNLKIQVKPKVERN